MKKGISLIVLVITIIVMIIIAGAIIISLSNGNVIAKANMGRIANDRSSLMEVATNRIGEYAVMNDGDELPTADVFAEQVGTGLTLAVYTLPRFPATGDLKGTWKWNSTAKEVQLWTEIAASGTDDQVATLLGITAADVVANPWIKLKDGTAPVQ